MTYSTARRLAPALAALTLAACQGGVLPPEDECEAIEALRTSNIKDVRVLGFDATPDALRAVRSGEMAATVEQSPSRQIRTALNQLVTQIRTGAPAAGASIQPVLIARENLQQAERIGEVR